RAGPGRVSRPGHRERTGPSRERPVARTGPSPPPSRNQADVSLPQLGSDNFQYGEDIGAQLLEYPMSCDMTLVEHPISRCGSVTDVLATRHSFALVAARRQGL